jgi:hypothetical protein
MSDWDIGGGSVDGKDIAPSSVNAEIHVRESDVSGDLGAAVNTAVSELPSGGGVIKIHPKSDGTRYSLDTKIAMDKPGRVVGPGRGVPLVNVTSDVVAFEGQAANAHFEHIEARVDNTIRGSHTNPIFHIGGRMECRYCAARYSGNQGFAITDYYSGNNGGFIGCRADLNGQNLTGNPEQGTGFVLTSDGNVNFVGSADGSFDANVFYCRGCEAGSNNGHGVHFRGNNQRVVGGNWESNGKYAVHADGASRCRIAIYSEGNSTGGVFLTSNTDNFILPNDCMIIDGVSDNGTNNTNNAGP